MNGKVTLVIIISRNIKEYAKVEKSTKQRQIHHKWQKYMILQLNRQKPPNEQNRIFRAKHAFSHNFLKMRTLLQKLPQNRFRTLPYSMATPGPEFRTSSVLFRTLPYTSVLPKIPNPGKSTNSQRADC